MKVLHCIPHVQAGGADVGTVELVRSLNRLDNIEARLCVFQGRQALGEQLRRVADPVLLDFRGSHLRPDEFLRFRATIRQVINDWQPDIVHSHLWPACRWATSALLSKEEIHHCWHVRDARPWLWGTSPRCRLLQRWTRYLLGRARPRLIAVSNAVASFSAEALDLKASSFQIISSGVDPVRFSPRPGREKSLPVIGLAAQFRTEKGHAVLLEAARRLREWGLAFEIRFAGDGALLGRTKALCAQMGIADCVRFLGRVEDVPGFLAGLDVFVLPSTTHEGLPLCLLEAMCMRVPVVATAVGGTPEIVRDGRTGRLVPPGNPVVLAEAVRQALQNREVSAAMAGSARESVLQNHTNDAIARKVFAVYGESLAAGNGEIDSA